MKTLGMACLSLFILMSSASTANMLVNGDFETGDLYGWIEAGPDTVPRYETRMDKFRPNPPPWQVFSAECPLYVVELFDDDAGVRRFRNIRLAPEAAPKSGYSAGWARTGLDFTLHPWLSQILQVAPGRYLVNASWDVISWGGKSKEAEAAIGGAMYVHVDDRVYEYTLAETTLRRTVWNTESRGEWITRKVEDFPIETNTGRIEVRFMVWISNEDPIAASEFEYVALDNVFFELTPVRLRQAGGGNK